MLIFTKSQISLYHLILLKRGELTNWETYLFILSLSHLHDNLTLLFFAVCLYEVKTYFSIDEVLFYNILDITDSRYEPSAIVHEYFWLQIVFWEREQHLLSRLLNRSFNLIASQCEHVSNFLFSSKFSIFTKAILVGQEVLLEYYSNHMFPHFSYFFFYFRSMNHRSYLKYIKTFDFNNPKLLEDLLSFLF